MPSVRQSGYVHVRTIAVLASPLDDLEWWNADDTLETEVPVVRINVADTAPYGTTWVARAAQTIHTARANGPILLVGAGAAGPLLPALANTQRPARRHVAGYVFVDATLPRPGQPTHLDLLRAADPAQADDVHRQLHHEGATWPSNAPHPGDHDFWTTSLPLVSDWPDAPCSYVNTSNGPPPGVGDAQFWARSAASRGWAVHTGVGPKTVVADLLRTG